MSELTAIIVLDDVFSLKERREFLDYAVDACSKVSASDAVAFGSLQAMVASRILRAWDKARAWLPFGEDTLSSIEMELAVYRDGEPLHADNELETDRFMNFVCFLHNAPRRFQGGRLRVWELAGGADPRSLTGRHHTVHSLQNQVVFLDSRLPYEVSPTKYFTEDPGHRLFVVRGWLRR